MKLIYPSMALIGLICALQIMTSGCERKLTGISAGTQSSESKPDAVPLVERVLTQAEQEALTPEAVLKLLKDGNERFVSGTLTARDHSKLVRDAALGQFPKAVVLSCLDSRIPVEDVFDRGIGDIFVARVAGNFDDIDILGSMEFACKVSGVKLVLVLGHEHCGALKGAIDGVELGNITPMLANILPAVKHFSSYEGDKTSANEEFVHLVAEQNVRMTIDDIRKQSPILQKMESDGQLKIVGAMYDMNSGKTTFLNPLSAQSPAQLPPDETTASILEFVFLRRAGVCDPVFRSVSQPVAAASSVFVSGDSVGNRHRCRIQSRSRVSVVVSFS